MRGVFVTGTDTGVGKTLFSTALLLRLGAEGIRAAACKPVAAGCRLEGGRRVNEDAELLAAAAPRGAPLETVNPVALEPAIAPHIAAAEAGVTLEPGPLVAACHAAGEGAEFLVVEGAGGWRVPLSASATLADVAIGLNFPVVLVVGLRLGCLNHALLSAEAIRADGLRLAGWVANPLAEPMPRLEENIATLTARLGAPLLARLPACDAGDPMLRARQAAAALPPGLAARLGPGEAIRDCT
jgi:dethiobiotin synthetase